MLFAAGHRPFRNKSHTIGWQPKRIPSATAAVTAHCCTRSGAPTPSKEAIVMTTIARNRAFLARAAVTAGAGAVLLAAMAGTAAADPGMTSDGATQANVVVDSAIALTGLTPGFTLSGIPGATAAQNGDVTFTVTTNNLAGYAVTVQSRTASLAPTASGDTAALPIGALPVREPGTGTFPPVSDQESVVVHSQDTRSAAEGDALSNDYRVQIPFVNEDTYTTTLDYIATTL